VVHFDTMISLFLSCCPFKIIVCFQSIVSLGTQSKQKFSVSNKLKNPLRLSCSKVLFIHFLILKPVLFILLSSDVIIMYSLLFM